MPTSRAPFSIILFNVSEGQARFLAPVNRKPLLKTIIHNDVMKQSV